MAEISLAPTAQQSTPEQEILLDRIEAEIARLRDKRPALDDRIDRAANILVTHLACPRQRVIRVRVVRNGKAKFLVDGALRGSVYVVDPGSWSCSCPDYHRSGLAVCKHGLACYVLWRASRPMRKKLLSCASCSGKFPSRELTEVTQDDELLAWFPGDRLCDACAARHWA